MLAFAPKLPCSCGGVIQKMTWGQHVIFNLFFTLLALVGIWLARKRKDETSTESQITEVVFT